MRFSNIKIGTRLLAGFGSICMLILALGVMAFVELTWTDTQWASFQNVTLQKSRAIAESHNSLGEGIQDFKNYVLRGQDYDRRCGAQV